MVEGSTFRTESVPGVQGPHAQSAGSNNKRRRFSAIIVVGFGDEV